MTVPSELITERLLLRRWRESDREPFAALNTDPRVMEHFPGVLNRDESDAVVDRIQRHFKLHGFGLWAVEIPGVTEFAGFIGLCHPRFEASFTPCVELGWRLAAEFWRRGYATEGARAVVRFGFEQMGLPELLAFTVPDNQRSRGVMERLGMQHDPADAFDHPLVEVGHRLRRHLIYRLPNLESTPTDSGSQ